MNIFTLAKLISRMKASQRHLIRCRWNGVKKSCPFCARTNPYILTNGRYECRRCKKDFSDFTGTWLHHAHINAAQWLVIIKLFEMELSARQAARQAILNYKTVARGYTIIRQASFSILIETLPNCPERLKPMNRISAAEEKETVVEVLRERCPSLVSSREMDGLR